MTEDFSDWEGLIMVSKCFWGPWTKWAFGAAAAILICCGLSGTAEAQITWGGATNILSDTDVITTGAFVYGYNWNNTDVTVNGVLFSGTNSITGATNVAISGESNYYNGGDMAANSSLPGDYKTLLNGTLWGDIVGPATVTLGGLATGHQYVTQFWTNDSRSGTNFTATLASENGNSVTLAQNTTQTPGGVGQYSLGYFAPSSSSQAFTVAGGYCYVQAMQVRDVTGTWSGTDNGNWADIDTTSKNFSGMSFTGVKSLVSNVYFADTDAFGNPVSTSAVIVGAGGASTGTVYFQNKSDAYTVTSSDGYGIKGSTAVNISGGGSVTFNGLNSYNGPTTVTGGTLALDAYSIQNSSRLTITNATVQTAGFNPFGVGNVTPITINTGGLLTQIVAHNVNLGAVTLNGGELSSNGLYDPQYGSYYLEQDIRVTGTATSTISALAITSGGPRTFNVDAGSTLNVTGYFSNLYPPSSPSFGLVKAGSGLMILSGSAVNTYAGGTMVNAGTLLLDYSNLASATNLVDASNVLTLGGGTLSINGNASSATSQTFASLTVNPAVSGITLTANGGQINTLTITSSTITQSVGGALNFVLPANTAVAWNPSLTNGIIGPAFTIGSGTATRYATVISGSVAPYIDGTLVTSISGNVSGANYELTAGGTSAVVGNAYASTVRYTGSDATIGVQNNNFGFNGFIAVGSAPTLTIGGSSNYITLGNYGDVGPAAGEIVINGLQNVIIPGNIYGPGVALTYNGSTTLTLAGGNNYSGPTTVNGGTLQLGDGTSGDDPSMSTSGISMNSAAVVYNVFSSQTANYPISGNGTLTKLGSGTLTLNGSNSFTGTTTINGGVVSLGNSAALAGGGNITFGGGALQFSAGNTVDYSARIKNSASVISLDTNGQSITFGSTIDSSNTGGLTKNGPGALTLTAGNSYSGSTTVNGGILNVGTNGAIPNNNAVTINGGTIEVAEGGGNSKVYNWYWDVGSTIINAGGDLDVQGHSHIKTLTLSGGTLSGSSPDTVKGYGSWWLDNDVTVTGGGTSTISAQQVGLTGGNRTFNVNNSSTLDFTGTIGNPYSNAFALTLAGDGTGTMILSGANTYIGGTTVLAGTLIVATSDALPDGTSLTVGADAGTIFGASAASARAAAVTAVPEPAALVLLTAALWSAVACHRFSRRPRTAATPNSLV